MRINLSGAKELGRKIGAGATELMRIGKNLDRKRKKQVMLSAVILILGVSVFFNLFFDSKAYASKRQANSKVSVVTKDPLARIGKGITAQAGAEKNEACHVGEKKKLAPVRNQAIQSLVAGHPIEAMVPAISKKNPKVAQFLVAIAKKESNWGVYSPKKDGRECFNYWGYKGGYNPTKSGYSCFDTPEQAVAEVGGRIEKLIGQKIDTPAEMIVWKCGRTCAGHDPAGVKKWINDVDLLQKKLAKI